MKSVNKRLRCIGETVPMKVRKKTRRRYAVSDGKTVRPVLYPSNPQARFTEAVRRRDAVEEWMGEHADTIIDALNFKNDYYFQAL